MNTLLDGIYRNALLPAYALLPVAMNSQRASQLVLSIGLQESGLMSHVQLGGPAHGLWQFEQFGGVRGAFAHPLSRDLLRTVCTARHVDFTIPTIYAAIVTDDVLAAACARLLLYTDPNPLPSMLDVQGAWNYYVRNWRPGKPRPETWADHYRTVLDYLMDGLSDGL